MVHTRSPLLEETHYYPFGLTMAGISNRGLPFNKPENKFKWNNGSELQSMEFSDENGLEWYSTQLRSLDPQLGRWLQIDSKPDYSQSLFCSMGNNPVLNNDPLGDTSKPAFPTTFNPFSPTNWYGAAAVANNNVRIAYDKTVKEIAPGDKKGRAELKELTRTRTPEPFRTIVETGRPIEAERAKVTDPTFRGNVTKTNAEVNEVVKNTGTIGKIFIAGGLINSAANIANAEEPGKQVVVEGGAWVGAIEGGSTGAALGSAFGPIGSFAGGVGGSIIGGIMGSKITKGLVDWFSENVTYHDAATDSITINGARIKLQNLYKR